MSAQRAAADHAPAWNNKFSTNRWINGQIGKAPSGCFRLGGWYYRIWYENVVISIDKLFEKWMNRPMSGRWSHDKALSRMVFNPRCPDEAACARHHGFSKRGLGHNDFVSRVARCSDPLCVPRFDDASERCDARVWSFDRRTYRHSRGSGSLRRSVSSHEKRSFKDVSQWLRAPL